MTGAQIRAARKRQRLTQMELVQKAGLSSPQYLSAIERGLKPGTQTLAKITKALGEE